MSRLTAQQRDVLLRPINGNRVSKDGKGYSHVEAYEVRAHLNRVFDFCGWDEETRSQELIFEAGETKRKRNKQGEEYGDPYTAWTVCYRTVKRLIVKAGDGTVLAYYDGEAVGDASNQPSRADAHDLALKTSASQALKRAAVDLGDQFGLGLYRKGSLAPLVGNTLLNMRPKSGESESAGQKEAPAVDSHITTPLPAEDSVEENPQREMSSPASAAKSVSEPKVAQFEGRPEPPAAKFADTVMAEVAEMGQLEPAQRVARIAELLTETTKHGKSRARVMIDGQYATLQAALMQALQAARAEHDDAAKVAS